MQLLDATLAFALTLAALATVVTTILEACFRILRMRKKNLIEVMKLLNNELGRGSIKMTPEERWDFFSRVVENPAEAVGLVSKIDWQNCNADKETTLANFLQSFGRITDCKGLYNKVTLEHVLRCLAEGDSVKRASLDASDKLKTEFNRIARKYEEFGSAVSSSYKQYAQAWSIGIGICLALVANVDGLRIFEAYQADPNLAAAVIEKHEDFIEKNQDVQDSIERLKALYLQEREAKKKLENDKLSDNDKEMIKLELETIQNRITEESTIANIEKTVQDAKNQIFALRELGVPIGWDFFPGCPYGKSDRDWLKSSPECQEIRKNKETMKWEWFGSFPLRTLGNDAAGFMVWFLKVAITGILIGLGAPFWFDVAKRLSQIRRGLKNPNASDEDRLAARDANGDADERKKIVEDVVSDIVKEVSASAVK
jgi:hypothetical protein